MSPMPLSRVLGLGHSRQGDPQPRPRRLVHLAEDQGGVGQHGIVRARNLAPLHFEPQVVALPGPLADAGKHGVAAVPGGDSRNQLLDDHGLSDTRAAEEPRLAAAHERAQQVDDFDAGFEHLALCRQIDQLGRVLMDRPLHLGVEGAALVDGFAKDVGFAEALCRPGPPAVRRYRDLGPRRRPACCSRRARPGAGVPLPRDVFVLPAKSKVISSALYRAGTRSGANLASKTLPMTWMSFPVFIPRFPFR
jgi:hypothetical protein